MSKPLILVIIAIVYLHVEARLQYNKLLTDPDIARSHPGKHLFQCSPVGDEQIQFKGWKFNKLRYLFRICGYLQIGKSGDTYRHRLTGNVLQFNPASLGLYGNVYDHVEHTHSQWAGYSLKMPLGSKFTDEYAGSHISKFTKGEEFIITDKNDTMVAIFALRDAMRKYIHMSIWGNTFKSPEFSTYSNINPYYQQSYKFNNQNNQDKFYENQREDDRFYNQKYEQDKFYENKFYEQKNEDKFYEQKWYDHYKNDD